jgi:ATP-dependent protease ClpP protease subunit
MSLRSLPKPASLKKPSCYAWDAPSDLLEKWASAPVAAAGDDDEINVYDVIGEDFMGEGVTASRVAAALREAGRKAVTVNINSPGGDMFEGLAIYNVLREHPAEVTVRVQGIAASAASLIAMAGDRIEMGVGSLMMIHNAWGAVIGNRHDFAGAAKVFETFDASMASIYAARTGIDKDELMDMLDGDGPASDGTWMQAEDAVQRGFADAVIEAPSGRRQAQALTPDVAAKRKMDAALAAQGLGRAERRAIMNDIRGTHDAAEKAGKHDATGTAKHDAGVLTAGLAQLLNTVRS